MNEYSPVKSILKLKRWFMVNVKELVDATHVAIEALHEFNDKAKDVTVEEAILNNGNIEVTLSYMEDGALNSAAIGAGLNQGASFGLLSMLGQRKKWRVFIIDKYTNTFKGFKAYNPTRN